MKISCKATSQIIISTRIIATKLIIVFLLCLRLWNVFSGFVLNFDRLDNDDDDVNNNDAEHFTPPFIFFLFAFSIRIGLLFAMK